LFGGWNEEFTLETYLEPADTIIHKDSSYQYQCFEDLGIQWRKQGETQVWTWRVRAMSHWLSGYSAQLKLHVRKRDKYKVELAELKDRKLVLEKEIEKNETRCQDLQETHSLISKEMEEIEKLMDFCANIKQRCSSPSLDLASYDRLRGFYRQWAASAFDKPQEFFQSYLAALGLYEAYKLLKMPEGVLSGCDPKGQPGEVTNDELNSPTVTGIVSQSNMVAATDPELHIIIEKIRNYVCQHAETMCIWPCDYQKTVSNVAVLEAAVEVEFGGREILQQQVRSYLMDEGFWLALVVDSIASFVQKLDRSEKVARVKRIRIAWHPDRNPAESRAFATKVFQHLGTVEV